jgi:archaemetzincin
VRRCSLWVIGCVLVACGATGSGSTPAAELPSAPSPPTLPGGDTPAHGGPRPASDPSGPEPTEPEVPEPEIAPKVVLVVLESFSPRSIAAVETKLRDELGVEVERGPTVPLPEHAYYPPRRRYRAEKLLDALGGYAGADAPATTKVLGLTEVDISTTNGKFEDWGIFGLGSLGGRAAVISSHRLRRGASADKVAFRIATTALHEIGHTFGLDHCTEARCPMQDAEGKITNTDSSTSHLGPRCRAAIDAALSER